MHYLRVFTGDDGETHLEDTSLPVVVAPAEPGVAELAVSDGVLVHRVHFVTVRASAQEPDWHCAPRRQLVVFLSGMVTIETSDGDRRVLPPGSTALVEDVDGPGHVTTHAPGDQQVLVVPLDP